MSFLKEYGSYLDKGLPSPDEHIRLNDIIFADKNLSVREYAHLLFPVCEGYLENMAQRAHTLTLQYFGRVMQLYTPMYISNYCVNECVYCNFNASRKISRLTMTLDEVEKEAEVIAKEGLRHVLILTGEDRDSAPLAYIKEAIGVLKKHFTSISVEIYPLEEDGYKELVDYGVDGLTLYQETYDKDVYDRVHPAGPKKNYSFRIDAPERAANAGMRTINIGSLLGLNDFRYESFITGLHAKYLQDSFPACEVSVSVPRLRPYGGMNYPAVKVSDKDLVQIITALRIFLHRIGITVSTRESAELRNDLLPLGVTRMSAGSTTKVGGRIKEACGSDEGGQFDISDIRDIRSIKTMLKEKGYQPVHQDWWGYERVK